MNSNSLGEYKSFTHIEHRSGAFGRHGLGHLNPVLTPEYLLPWIPVLFTFFTVQIPIHTALKCWREPIRYVTLHFQDWRGSFAPLQKSRGNHSCYMWTEASSGMVYASAVRYIVWAELEFLVGWLINFTPSSGRDPEVLYMSKTLLPSKLCLPWLRDFKRSGYIQCYLKVHNLKEKTSKHHSF